jgi:hypothetical protein
VWGRNVKETKQQGDETTGHETAGGRNDWGRNDWGRNGKGTKRPVTNLPSSPLPNNSKYWSKLVKMENIWLKLVEVAGQAWKSLSKFENKVSKILSNFEI